MYFKRKQNGRVPIVYDSDVEHGDCDRVQYTVVIETQAGRLMSRSRGETRRNN